MTDDRFAADHAPGNRVITASRWAGLVLGPQDRPDFIPSPLALALHMRGDVPIEAEGAHLERGKLMEPVGAELARTKHGLAILGEQVRRERPDVPALTYLDIVSDRGPLELKTVNSRDFDREWPERPPLHVRIQGQAQLAVTGDPIVLIAAIVMGYRDIRLEIFEEPRHEPMISLLEDRAREFLAMIDRGELPPPDESASSYTAWSATAAFDKGTSALLAEPEAIDRANRWRQARADKKAADAIEEAQRRWFMAHAPSGAERIELLDGSVIKRSASERKGYTVESTRLVQWRFEH